MIRPITNANATVTAMLAGSDSHGEMLHGGRQKGSGVGAKADKCGLSERGDAGRTGHDAEPDTDKRVDADIDQIALANSSAARMTPLRQRLAMRHQTAR